MLMLNNGIEGIEDLFGSKVIGLRREYILTHGPGEEAFDEVSQEGERYTIFVKKESKEGFCGKYDIVHYYSITLSQGEGWCGSGFTSASWGNIEISYIEKSDHIGPLTHLPINRDLRLEKKLTKDKYPLPDVSTNLFDVSFDGEDSFYPCGYIDLNFELFYELPRAMKSRPRYIVYGGSGLGKSTIGLFLKKDLTVYETDSNKDLPEVIWEDIVILGNKYDFTEESVKNHLSSKDNIICIEFKKGE